MSFCAPSRATGQPRLRPMNSTLGARRDQLGDVGDRRRTGSRISWICSGSRCSPRGSACPRSAARSRIRPRYSASSANAVTVVGERLGGGHRHLRARVQVDAAVDLPGDRGADDVDDADHPAALALQLLHRGEGVDRLARLADRDVERVRLDDRVAVAELRRRLRRGGHAGEVLDQLRAEVTRVAGRAAAEDLHALDLAGLADGEVEPAEVGGGEALVDAAARTPARSCAAARRSP